MHSQNPVRIILGIAFILLLEGFSVAPRTQEIGAMEAYLGQSGRNFAISLFKTIEKAEPNKNIIISPASASITIAMTYSGGSRDTRASIADTLGFGTMTEKDILQSHAILLRELQKGDSDVTLTTANALWLKEGLRFKKDFVQDATGHFGAKTAVLDFGDPKSPEVINKWAQKATKGKIEKIVEKISGDIYLYVTNAVYFKGGWKYPFEKEKTQISPFHLSNGLVTDTQMMYRKGPYPYLQGAGFQAISLPYGEGRFRMIIFLPADHNGLAQFIKRFTPENFYTWTSEMNTQRVQIGLPRFELENGVDLAPSLRSLGLDLAFEGENGGFEGITETAERIYISSAIQKTYIEVNEEGTEAAAVTKIGIGPTSVNPDEFQMIVDRPFLFAIHEEKTDTLLFLGAVYEP